MPTSADFTVRSILESNTLLNALTDAEMIELAGVCRVHQCHKSEQIWSMGSTVGFFGLIGSGFVKMVKSNPTGTEMTLEVMGPGQIFGLLATLEGTGCPLSAHGLTDTVYLRIPKQEFLRIYEGNAELKDRLFRRTIVRMHQKLDFMALLSSGRAEERLASILFVLAESYGTRVGNTIKLSLPLTRQVLGEMAGTTTETTIRVLSKWTQQKLIDTDHHVITITDVAGLEQRLQ